MLRNTVSWINNFKDPVRRISHKILRYTLSVFGMMALLFFILSFTSAPYHLNYWLGTSNSKFEKEFVPDYIVMLGGSGMPGEANLIRLYYTAFAGNCYDSACIILSLPADSMTLHLMKEELVVKGIYPDRIKFEKEGTNTRGQALEVLVQFPEIENLNVLLITSPSHMYRSIKVFKKAGIENISGLPAFEKSLPADLVYRDKELGGRVYIPGVGDKLKLRYNFWTYLQLEIICLREFCALGYYWLKGWV